MTVTLSSFLLSCPNPSLAPSPAASCKQLPLFSGSNVDLFPLTPMSFALVYVSDFRVHTLSLLWFLFPFSSLLLSLLPSHFSSLLFIQNKGYSGECTFIFLLLIFLLNTLVSSEKHVLLGLLFPETIIYLLFFMA